MKLLGILGNHLKLNRELYVHLPLAFLLVWLGIKFAGHLTGRAVLDDPGALVGLLYNFAGAVLVCVLTGLTKPHLFDDIDTRKPDVTTMRVAIDSCETIFLLCFFGWVIFH